MSYLTPVLFCTVPLAGGVFNFLLMFVLFKERSEDWDKSLKTPPWDPPPWLVPVVWTFLFITMGYSSYLVWRDGGGFSGYNRIPLIAYACQLLLNWAWPLVVFGIQDLKWGFIETGALTASVAICLVLFATVNRLAGLLFVPYLAWISFATYLMYTIWQMNPAVKIDVRLDNR